LYKNMERGGEKEDKRRWKVEEEEGWSERVENKVEKKDWVDFQYQSILNNSSPTFFTYKHTQTHIPQIPFHSEALCWESLEHVSSKAFVGIWYRWYL
jgi:hypothetical protein